MYNGILVDWGGVLTTSISAAIASWIAAERLDAGHYHSIMRDMVREAYSNAATSSPIHALERGEIDPADFERALAVRLRTQDGTQPLADGLLNRMFAAFEPVEEMYDILRTARAAGLRTCLVSNSWGNDYPRDSFDGVFDDIVISAEVGMRKPDAEIFRLALDRVRLAPAESIFIDDIRANVDAAEKLGITGIHHTAPAETITRLRTLCRI